MGGGAERVEGMEASSEVTFPEVPKQNLTRAVSLTNTQD